MMLDGADDDGSEPPDPIIIEIDHTGRYHCYKDVMGRGAYKTVYKAFDEVDGVEVAWNQVRIDDVMHCGGSLERLYSEIDLLKSLSHDNIVKYYASWVDDQNKTVNIITELFISGSLKQYCKKHQKVDIKAVKEWARQILMGLDYLHNQKPPVIHRDLKCDNIFINGNLGVVKIGDLGLATVMQQPYARSVIGTPEFMAPEIYDEEYNELVDIYSFGMCLLEMVTFEYPYSECTNFAQIYRKVSSGIKPAVLSKIKDPEVKGFIEKCLLPASQRLPAKDLLKDPFLHFFGENGIQSSAYLHLPNIHLQTAAASVDHLCLLEEPMSGQRRMSGPNNIDDDENKIATIELVENVRSNDSQFLTIQKKRKSDVFILQGQRKDGNSVALLLRIFDLTVKVKVRTVDFAFFLDSDTALSVASEMVEQVELSEKDIEFIADLIDSLLLNLIPGWKSSFVFTPSLNKIVFSDHKTSSGSSYDEQHSEMSFVSAISLEETDEKFSRDSFLGYMEFGKSKIDAEAQDGTLRSDSSTQFQKLPSNWTSDGCSYVANDDEELKLELRCIEQQYWQAFNSLSEQRLKAIEDAKGRAATKKQSCFC